MGNPICDQSIKLMMISEFCNAAFNKEQWARVPESEKLAHGFNLIRFISIKYPADVQQLNHKDVNVPDVLDFWSSYLSPRFSSTPQWFWTTAGKNKERLMKAVVVKKKTLLQEVDKTLHVAKKLVSDYCDFTCTDYGMVMDMYEMDPKETVAGIKKYKDHINKSQNG